MLQKQAVFGPFFRLFSKTVIKEPISFNNIYIYSCRKVLYFYQKLPKNGSFFPPFYTYIPRAAMASPLLLVM